MKPTKEEVEAEITALTEMKPNVRKTSVFGDNHHDAIDAQIHVLMNDLDYDDVYTEYEGGRQNILEEALVAMEWMAGHSEEQPSENWKSLVD